MAYKRKVKLNIDKIAEKANPQTELVSINGATSSRIECDMHDVPYAIMRMIGNRFAYGRKRHGRFNWKKGDKFFAEERLKHLVNHVMLFAEYRRLEDLEALLCNGAMIAWYWDNGLVSQTPIAEFMMDGKEK